MKLRSSKQPPKNIRNATNPGNAPVFSYYASRSQPDKSSRGGDSVTKHRSLLSRLKFLPSLIAVLVIILSIAYTLVLDSVPRVVVVGRQDGTPTLLQDVSVYRAAATDILDNSIFSKLKLTINTRSVEQQLLERFPELKDVSITVPLASHTLVAEVAPTKPWLVLSGVNGTYVIDERGRAVVLASEVPALSKLDLPVVIDETGLELETGKAVLPTENAIFITQLLRQLKAQSITIDSVTLPAIANDLHIKLKGEGYFVKFNIKGDPRLQAGVFVAVRKRLAREGVTPTRYIDVRVEDKAFYK